MHVPDGIRVPRTAILVGLLAFCLSVAVAQPSPRGYVDMVYDSGSGAFVLFGGQTGDAFDPAAWNDETWIYDPARSGWDRRTPDVSPPPASAYAIAYDAESDRVVVWGGAQGLHALTGLWSYDTDANTWTEHPGIDGGPSPRIGSKMVYSSASDRIILYGGLDPESFAFYAETWSLDFDTLTWTKLEPEASPSGRNFQSMAYDEATDTVFVWGGNDQRPDDVLSMARYDVAANAWSIDEAAPPRNVPSDPITAPTFFGYGAMVVLPGSGGLLHYGGGDGGSDQTWLYDTASETWTRLDIDGPGELSRHAMAADDLGAVVFGGQLGARQYEYGNETWRFDFDSMTWQQP